MSYHVLTFLPITVIGIYYFVTLGLKLSDMRATSAAPTPSRKRDERAHRARGGAGEAQPRAPRARPGARRISRDRDAVRAHRLADTVTVRLLDGERTLAVHGLDVGPTEENLAYRAAVAYGDATGWPDGFAIDIDKRIPVGGGFGGGSADAGGVLRA